MLFQVMRYLGIREVELPKKLRQFNRASYPDTPQDVIDWLTHHYKEWNQRLHEDFGIRVDDWSSG